ncbi:MAG: flippase-like domain-containing protein [Clostridia bacterium]|nr:flippase-like domain-containing protein [Clostridia bacterium]
MEKNNKKHIGMYVLYGALTAFILVLILSFNDIGEIMSTIMGAHAGYVLLAVLSLAVYVALYPLSLCILTKARGCDIRFGTTYNIAMTEHFFNGITPSATGGQPFQAYAFKKAGVRVSESTCLLLMNFMVFMTVTNAFALSSLFYFNRFVTDGAMAAVAVVGFTMNFAVLGITVLLATSSHVRRALSAILVFLCKFKWIAKFLAPRVENLNEYFENVQLAFRALIKKKLAFVLALLTKVLSMAAYYVTTFFILRALWVDVPLTDIFFVICGTSFAVTMVVFIPTPGSSGGIEFAFKSVFATIAAGAAASVSYGGMLIWRLLSYYLVMLVSLAFYVLLELGFSRKHKAAQLEGVEE